MQVGKTIGYIYGYIYVIYIYQGVIVYLLYIYIYLYVTYLQGYNCMFVGGKDHLVWYQRLDV